MEIRLVKGDYLLVDNADNRTGYLFTCSKSDTTTRRIFPKSGKMPL